MCPIDGDDCVNENFEELRTRLSEIGDIGSSIALLYWDQSTYMPEGSAMARGRQLGTLSKMAHKMFIDPEIGELLENNRVLEDNNPYDSFEASFIRVTKRDYDKATKIPPEFTAKLSMHNTEMNQAWVKARPADDFSMVQPYLEKTVVYSREMADFFPGYEHIADPLIDLADYGMKASNIRKLFAELREELVPVVKKITELEPVDDSFLCQPYDKDKQLEFSKAIAKDIGYDFATGREDMSPHPFTISLSIHDVRITTRIDPNDPRDCIFSTIHEAGHGMYEQGIDPEFEGTSLAGGTSSGVHESQSRLWENIVGRSLGFWKFYYPKMQEEFPEQLGNVPLDAYYKAVNKVQKSLIRTDADEVTYNLHVMLRFDLELDMLEGKLAIADLANEWRRRFEADMGVSVPDDKDGVLQDIHWYHGMIGGQFQGYTLGNIMGAQFYEAALKAHPEIPGQIELGKFDTLHSWLKNQIYQHGRKFTANEIVENVTGKPLTIEPYMKYLKEKYGDIYGITL